jgi:hypothetical protein
LSRNLAQSGVTGISNTVHVRGLPLHARRAWWIKPRIVLGMEAALRSCEKWPTLKDCDVLQLLLLQVPGVARVCPLVDSRAC